MNSPRALLNESSLLNHIQVITLGTVYNPQPILHCHPPRPLGIHVLHTLPAATGSYRQRKRFFPWSFSRSSPFHDFSVSAFQDFSFSQSPIPTKFAPACFSTPCTDASTDRCGRSRGNHIGRRQS